MTAINSPLIDLHVLSDVRHGQDGQWDFRDFQVQVFEINQTEHCQVVLETSYREIGVSD